MASDALEEKINKIKLQNEEIRRRYEEVEADKKNAAKLNALVKMVPSDDWPERKEPPEFSAPIKVLQKKKNVNKEYNDRLPQHYSGIQERLGKKDYKFSQGDGPPPDPKYNFLADSEREVRTDNSRVDEGRNKSRNKTVRGTQKKKGDSGGGSKDAYFKDNRGPHAFYSKEEALPEYEAWRAERNRIDEARINRQKTAEGNWRREWDSNKTNIEKDASRKGDSNRKDINYDRKNNHYENDYTNRGHGGSRTYHGSQKNHNHQDYRRLHHEQVHEYKTQVDNKSSLCPTDDRTVSTTDKSIKVTLNHGNQLKGPVMSVKVNSPSIAGTGRVGPRQKSRVTYSSQSDADLTIHELNNFSRQKSFDEKTAGPFFNSGQKSIPKSPFSHRKKEGNAKSPYVHRKEFRNDELSTRPKIAIKGLYSQRNEPRDQKELNNFTSKVRIQKRNQKSLINKTETLFLSDEAIPSEYNPEKLFNSREDLKNQKIDIENDNFEETSNKINNMNENFLDILKNVNDSATNDKFIIDDYDNSIANTNYQNSNNIKIDQINKNNEHINIDKDIKDAKTTNINEVKIDKNVDSTKIDENIKHLKNSYYIEDKDHNNDTKCENIKKNITEIENINDVLENIREKSNEKLLPESDISVMEEKDNLCMFTKGSVIMDVSNEKIPILCSETIKENESLKNFEITGIKIIETEQKSDELKRINNQFQETNNDLKNDFVISHLIDNIKNEIELQDQNSTEINISQNEGVNTSCFKTMELVNFEKQYANDSGFIDDFDKLQNNFDTSIIEFNDENNTKKKSVMSDSMELTKEMHTKDVEICDIRNAAINKTFGGIKGNPDENGSRINKKEVNKIFGNYTKDNEVYIVDNININLESKYIDIQKKSLSKSTEENTVKAESIIEISDENTKLDSDKLKPVASDESTKTNEFTRVIFNQSTKIACDEINEA